MSQNSVTYEQPNKKLDKIFEQKLHQRRYIQNK